MLLSNQRRLLKDRGSLKVQFYFYTGVEDCLALLKSREEGLMDEEVDKRPCREDGRKTSQWFLDLFVKFTTSFCLPLLTTLPFLFVIILIATITERKVCMVKTLRNGKWKSIKEDKIVEGDIIALEKTDKVPFNCRIIEIPKVLIGSDGRLKETDSMEMNGSIPKPIDQSNMLHRDSSIYLGSCKAVVVEIY